MSRQVANRGWAEARVEENGRNPWASAAGGCGPPWIFMHDTVKVEESF